jgi:ribosome-associated translation inhibitor RaiA
MSARREESRASQARRDLAARLFEEHGEVNVDVLDAAFTAEYQPLTVVELAADATAKARSGAVHARAQSAAAVAAVERAREKAARFAQHAADAAEQVTAALAEADAAEADAASAERLAEYAITQMGGWSPPATPPTAVSVDAEPATGTGEVA